MLRSTLRKLSRTLTSTTRRPTRFLTRRASLQVESLEDRLVLSTTLPPGLFQPQPLQIIQGVEGRALGAGTKGQAAVAFFNSTDKNVADFTATIKWGDGTTSPGTIVLAPAQSLLLGRPSPLGGTLHLPGGLEVQGTHTYTHLGDYLISATVTSRAGALTLGSKAHIVNAPLLPLAPGQLHNQPSAVTPVLVLQASEGVAMPQTQVASFFDTNPFGVLADHSAVISWGDGTTSIGLIKPVNGIGPLATQLDHFIVVGSHTYAQAGSFTVTTTIQDTTKPTFGQPLVISEAMKVKDLPLTAVPVAAFNLVEGTIIPLGKVVGSFKDGNPLAQASDFTAQVNFGDGTTAVGAVVADAAHPGVFDVLTPVASLSHGYAAGSYHLKATVSDRGGSQVVTDMLVQVADAPLILQSATAVSAFTRLPLTNTPLGVFVDGSTSSLVHDTSEAVTITWGDGSSSTGHVVDNGNGTYSVVGSHTYTNVSGATPFAIHVVVKDKGGQSLTFNTQATVQDSNTLLPGFVTNELNSLQASIDQKIFGKALPLIGTALSKLGDGSAQDANPIDRIVSSFKQAFIDGAQAAIGGDAQAVEDAIIKDLGQGAASILQGINATSDGNGGFTAEVHLKESATLNSGTVDLDLGLPGLPIHVSAQNLAVNVQVGFDIVLDFGIHNGSPFLQTKADASNTANPLGAAFDLHAQIAPGSSVSASLGGLTATLTQPVISTTPPVLVNFASVVGPTSRFVGLGGGIVVGGLNSAPPSTFDASLKFGFSVDANGGIQLATPQLSGAADIHLQASLTLGDRPRFVILGQPGLLPSVTAGLNINWSFNSADPTAGGLLGNAPTVSFNDVTVDLGSFLSNVVRPVVTAVQKYTQPLEKVAEFLTAPLPGVTDVTNLLGMDPITVASLIGGSTGGTLTTFAKAIEFINGLQIPATGSITVDVGSFNITDARQANSPATNFAESAAVAQHGLLGAAGGISTYSDLQTKADFDFPMLDNPVSFVSNVLLGHQVDLVKANLGVSFSGGINFNIPLVGIPDIASINANFFGSLTVDAGATFVLNDAFLLGGSLLDSLQVQNAHLDVSVEVGVGAGVSIFVASASLDGTVGVTVDLGLTNSKTGSTTFSGSDLINGNVSLNVTDAQLTAGLQFEVDVFGDTVYKVNDPLFTVDLIPGASGGSTGGGSTGGGSTGGGSTGGGGGGGGGGGLGGGPGHQLN
jgi:hypothetical protein